jgi:NAD-dependent DNA ligase
MSSEQRKYLFRLVYSVVPSKDLALERVLTALGVQRLEHATRSDAARAIDSLKEEVAARGAGRRLNGHGNGSENGASRA